MANPEPIPTDAMVKVGKSFAESPWTVTDKWFDWFLNQATIVTQTPRRLVTVSIDGLTGAAAATPMLAGNPGGLFRVTVFVRVEEAATTSSSVSVQIGATDSGQAYLLSTTPIVNGAAGAAWSQSFLVPNDQAVALTYATTYASVGATPLKYRIRIVVERN